LEKQGDTTNAAAAYEKAVTLNPGDLVARQNLSRLKPAENTAPDQSATASGEDDPQKISQLEDYIRESRFPEAEPLLATYVQQHPHSSWGWYALGYCQFAQKKIGESIKSLAQSLALDVRNAQAHKILGRDLMVIGRYDSAQLEFEQGIRYDPASAENHYDLGKLFSLQDDWEEARKQFAAAVEIDPSYVEAVDGLGFAQEALGQDAAAVQSYEKAITLNQQKHGDFVGAHVDLSAYYNRTGDPAKAIEYAQQALQLNPKADSAWFQKAKAEETQGRLPDAADSLNQAISLNQRSSSYYYVLAGIYRRLGKTADSQKALEAFSRLDKENNELEKMRQHASKSTTEPHP
jgi:tetratricopeptide (TPR) repeat protein